MDGNLILQNLGAWMAVVKPRKASWRRGQEKSHRKTEGEDSKESREDGVKLGLHTEHQLSPKNKCPVLGTCATHKSSGQRPEVSG